jgi:PEP-CTERM motif
MKHFKLKLAVLAVGFATTLPAFAAQPLNIVGYYNRRFYAGDNLVANQLSKDDNRLDSLLTNGVPDGATFTKWSSSANQFLPSSVFDAASDSWSINYDFNPVDGLGGVLHSPSPFTNTFVGEVYQGHDFAHSINGSLFGTWDGPPRPGGLSLLADQDPITATFENVVGRAALDGEWVRTLNEASQTYSVTTFHQISGWDNGQPMLAIGQGAYFELVPEPSTVALGGLGAAALTLLSRRKWGISLARR